MHMQQCPERKTNEQSVVPTQGKFMQIYLVLCVVHAGTKVFPD